MAQRIEARPAQRQVIQDNQNGAQPHGGFQLCLGRIHVFFSSFAVCNVPVSSEESGKPITSEISATQGIRR